VEDAFAAGMRARADDLGDTGESAPSQWRSGWECKDLHVAFWLQALTPEALDRAGHRLLCHFESSFQIHVDEAAQRLGGPDPKATYEHFGFRDGISQPWVESVQHPRRGRQGGGKRTLRGRWRPIALGEFVVGQVDETDDIFPVPEPAEIFLGGTFL